MKNKFLVTLALVAFYTLHGMAQTTTIDKMFDQLAGKEYITTISFTPEMFKLVAGISEQSTDPQVKEINEVVNQLKALRIIVLSDSLQKSDIDLVKETNALLKTNPFSELMSVQEKNRTVKFYIKKTTDNKINELIMLATEKNNVVVMNFAGDIDLNTIGKLSKTMKINGMEQLEKLEKK
ncbi:MAG: DUF4252 domain-containing protein [Bacteroidales bacterium]|nr:DUF4252 domain-containing protein [Bacteroidales bacterium]